MNTAVKGQSEKNGTIQRYENPRDIGILMRFEDAVKVLCTETGALNKRLYRAYYSCGLVHLYSNNFRDEFICRNLREIEIMADAGLQSVVKIKLPQNCYISPKQFDLHWKQSTKMASYIFQIYRYLINLRISEE